MADLSWNFVFLMTKLTITLIDPCETPLTTLNLTLTDPHDSVAIYVARPIRRSFVLSLFWTTPINENIEGTKEHNRINFKYVLLSI